MDTQSPNISEPDTIDPATYRSWREDSVRFNDLDPLWHLTSTAFMVMFETARILFVRTAGQASAVDPVGWMLVNANVNYLSQVHFPSTVRIGTRVQRLGRSSLTTVQGMFNGDRCAATLVTTLVLVDRDLDRSMPLPEDLKRHLQTLSDTGTLATG